MSRSADRPPAPPGLRIRLVFEDGAMIGPGKADLLELIRETGSIAAAGRRLGMSYKRAWLLVETLNATFAAPLIESRRGGPGFGGAALTEAGERALAHYRRLQAKASRAAAAEVAALRRMRADRADEK
jgi:molybdate transport system regulatory protein